MILADIIAENEAWLLVSVIFYLPNLPSASAGRESASFTHFLHTRGGASPQARGTPFTWTGSQIPQCRAHAAHLPDPSRTCTGKGQRGDKRGGEGACPSVQYHPWHVTSETLLESGLGVIKQGTENSSVTCWKSPPAQFLSIVTSSHPAALSPSRSAVLKERLDRLRPRH